MRLFSQLVTIYGRYCLFNDPKATDEEDDGDANLPGIKMQLQNCLNVTIDSLVESSEWAENFSENVDFKKNLHQKICGEDSRWTITRVRIDDRSIELRLVNVENYLMHLSGQDVPYYIEHVDIDVSSIFQKCPEFVRLNLRFTVPRADGDVDYIDVVFRSNRDYIVITEYEEKKKRIINMHPATDDLWLERRAIITECTDCNLNQLHS